MISNNDNYNLFEEENEIKERTSLLPLGALGIVPMAGCEELSEKINFYISNWRTNDKEYNLYHKDTTGHVQDSYIMKTSCPRFNNGEGKAIVESSVRGKDLFIISDVGNYGCKFEMYGEETRMSPDDHFQDLKRIISVATGKARRVNVIMPMLYGSRQDKRIARESLDCALALKELENLGVTNIITFDAHDPKVQNSIPLGSFENVYPTYQVIKALLRVQPNLEINKDNMMVISPDVGGMSRNIYYANVLGLNVGMFYKRRDLTKMKNGRNPIVAHEFVGDDIKGKDVIITDDILDSGDSILEVIDELKKRKVNKIFIAVSFGLFTKGLDKFNEYYEKGMFTNILSTNLTYRSPELLAAPWYVEVDASKYIAYLIDALNHDESISSLLNPTKKIHDLIDKYKNDLARRTADLV